MRDELKDLNDDEQLAGDRQPVVSGTAGTSAAPPPKPERTTRAPAPIQSFVKPPRSLRVARLFLLTGILLAVALAVVTFLQRESHIERLVALVTERDPDRSAESLEAIASILFWGSFGALVVVVLLQALTLSALMRRHAWARIVLLILLVLQAGAVLLAADFLTPSGDEGEYTLLALGALIPLAGLGLLIAFLPAVSTWLRVKDRR